MRKLHDKYFKQAKREGKLARSVYKLEQLDKKDKLFKQGDKVLDLGASPGSWLEYVLTVIGPNGIACAVDIKPIHKKFKGKALFKKMDIRELTGEEFLPSASSFDVIISDMAPNTSGIKIVDQARSLELCESAFDLAQKVLCVGGNFVCKIFAGPEVDAFAKKLAPYFKDVKLRKPDACREESSELYVIALGLLKKAVLSDKN